MILSHAVVTAPGAAPSSWMFFLHGILGSGANWRGFAKQIVEARPTWGAVLVDLRLHGESQRGFAPPHTIEACGRDVLALASEIERAHGGRLHAVLGHSFGGKVAIEAARACGDDVRSLFVVDSTPSARPSGKGSESTRHIVELLRGLPEEFPDRASFTAWIEERGVNRPTAMWLAMNVKPLPNTTRFVFRVDVAGVRAMLDDYFAVDLWAVLEARRSGSHLIVGGRSGVVDEADRARAQAAAPAVTLDVIEDADHWVHVDAPDALRAIVLRRLDEDLAG